MSKVMMVRHAGLAHWYPASCNTSRCVDMGIFVRLVGAIEVPLFSKKWWYVITDCHVRLSFQNVMASLSSTREVRGRIVHRQAHEWSVFVAYRLSILTHIF